MNTIPLRVAIVSREYPPFFGGGIGTYARWIVPTLSAAGVRVHVITEAHDRTQPRVEIEGLTTIHRVPVGIGRGGWTNAAARFSIQAGRVVSKLWRSGQVDIAEFAECEAGGLATLLLRGSSERIPTIIQLHTPSEQLFVLRSLTARRLDHSMTTYFQCERLAMNLADAILAPSQFIADWASAHYGFKNPPAVIPYATGPLPPPPPPPSNQSPTVLYAGRIEPRKGVESLIRAWNGVIARFPDARLHLAGADTSGAPDGGSMRAYLLELLDDAARERVVFLGRLGADSLRNEYARANLCVIPSLWENFPNTCIESMSHARAVLVGDEGGMREMIGTTQAGLTFKAGDEQDLQDKLISMLAQSPEDLAQRGRVGRARIEHLCDPARIATLRVEQYRSVIEAAHLSGPSGDSGTRAAKSAWLGFEQLAANSTPEINLPNLSSQVEQWVHCMEDSPC